MVTEIVFTPTLIIPSTQNEAKAKQVLEMIEKTYAIANSIRTKNTLEPILKVK